MHILFGSQSLVHYIRSSPSKEIGFAEGFLNLTIGDFPTVEEIERDTSYRRNKREVAHQVFGLAQYMRAHHMVQENPNVGRMILAMELNRLMGTGEWETKTAFYEAYGFSSGRVRNMLKNGNDLLDSGIYGIVNRDGKWIQEIGGTSVGIQDKEGTHILSKHKGPDAEGILLRFL